jgi:pimeloyl-ACP methyl ester carboxylesterase
MLARIQQFITLSLLAVGSGWLVYFWPTSVAWALGGFITLILGYSGILALEFVAQKIVSHDDPAPRPDWVELAAAWLGETLTAPRVFCWRQPFFSGAYPDQVALQALVPGRRGVVFVHGFFCNRGFWTPWLKQLDGAGYAFLALSLEPAFGSIDNYTLQIEAAVKRVTEVTGLPPLLVCHSMGGLAVRAWLNTLRDKTRVHHVVTLATPHRGTWLARFSHVTNGRQMQWASPWLQALEADELAMPLGLFTCWYSNCDNIVFPCSTATLPYADNRLMRGAGHVQLAFLPQLMQHTLAMLGEKAGQSD